MAAIPQTYINQLIAENNLDVLDGSIIQIIGMNFAGDGSISGQWGDPTYPDNYRYVSWFYPNPTFPYAPSGSGAQYSSVNDVTIQWKFSISTFQSGTYTFEPVSAPGNYISWYPTQSYNDLIGDAMNDSVSSWSIIHQDADPAVRTSYNGVQYIPIRIMQYLNPAVGWSNAWTSPEKGGNYGLIVANSSSGTQLISVVTPGNKLMANYCQGINFGTQFCFNYCTTGPGNCASDLSAYCQGANLEQDVCLSYCTDKNNNCDLSLTAYCASKLSSAGGNYTTFLNDPDNVKLCGCFLDQTVYQSFAKQLQLTWQIPASVNVTDCFFPPCANATGLTPYNWKNGPQNCPSTCINAVIINNDGTIGPISFNQSNNCGGTAVDPNKPPTPPPKPKPPHKPKPSPKHDNGLVALLGLIFLIVIVVSFAVLFLRHHNKPPPPSRRRH